jgi:hypothetical protein
MAHGMQVKYLYIISIAIIMTNCNKEHSVIGGYEECHTKNSFDSIQTIDHMIGTWKLLRTVGANGTEIRTEETFIVLLRNGSYNIISNGTKKTGFYSVMKSRASAAIYSIESHPGHLYGKLFFCMDRMLVSDLERDGLAVEYLKQ